MQFNKGFNLIILNLFISTYNTLLFSFEKREKENNDLIQDLIFTNIYTNFLIGNPKQIIQLDIKLENYNSFISGSNINGHQYNEQKSITYINTSEKFEDSSRENIEEGYISKESFTFNDYNNKKIEYKNFPFALATTIFDEKELNILGLNLYNSKISNIPNFLMSLREHKIIDERIFYFKINNNNINLGKLIIGNYPHDIETKEFNKNYLLNMKPVFDVLDFKWDIQFYYIKSNNKFIPAPFNVKLRIELGVIISNSDYLHFINDYFFNKLIEKNKCNYSTIKKKKYKYFICDNDIDLKTFPQLEFYDKENNFTFVLNSDDLFYKYKNKIYFLIVFTEKNINYWIFGRPFFKKYKLIFNVEKRLISYYSNYGNNNKSIFWINLILILLVIVILILVLYLIYYLKNKPKKLFAKELIEEINT